MTANVERNAASPSSRLEGQSVLRWAIHRTLLGVLILSVTVSAAAWLLYTAIDQDAEARGIEARAPASISSAVGATGTPEPAARP